MARPTRAQQIANYKSFLVEEGYEIIKQETYRCRKCEEYKPKKDFYEAMNPKMDTNGIMSICKDCANEIVDDYFKIFQNFEKAMLYACEDLDVVYYEPSIEALKTRMANAIRDGKEFNGLFGQYKSSIAQNKNNINGFRFRDSDVYVDKVQEVKEKVKSMLESTEEISDFEITKDIVSRWGKNWDESQYIRLENYYNDMCAKNRIETPQDIDYVKKIVALSIKIDDAISEGQSNTAKQLGDLYSKYMSDAKFRAMDMTDADKQGGIRTFSQIWEEVERPDFIPPWEKFAKKFGVKQDLVDKAIMHIENFTLKFFNSEKMITPPNDTPKVGD